MFPVVLPSFVRHSRLLPALIVLLVVQAVLLNVHAGPASPDDWSPSARLAHPNEHPLMSYRFCDATPEPPCGADDSDFGSAVALDAATAVVGHPHAQAAHFYADEGGSWEHVTTVTGPPGFGKDVAIEGELAAATAGSIPQLQILRWDGSGWHLNATLQLPARSCIRAPVDIDGGRIAVSVPCSSTIWIYEWDGTTWEGTTISAPPGARLFGTFVSMTKDALFAGSRDHVFALDAHDDWNATQVAALSATSLAGEDGRLAVATRSELFVFEKTPVGWTETARLTPSDASPFDGHTSFGRSIAFKGDTAVVGALEEDPSPGSPPVDESVEHPCIFFSGTLCVPPRSGAVYVFDRIDGVWQQTEKVVGEKSGDDRFGSSVALDGSARTLLVGAPGRTLPYFAALDVDIEDTVQVFTRGGA